MKVYVLSGLPGSGKSTWARNNIKTVDRVAIISADDYFIQSDGSWKFNPAGLPLAHANCLKKFIAYCRDPEEYNVDLVIVDNTNLSVGEIAPYMAVAQAYGHNAMVVSIPCPADLAFQRQTHGVPLNTFMHMFANQRELKLPSWWKRYVAIADSGSRLSFKQRTEQE